MDNAYGKIEENSLYINSKNKKAFTLIEIMMGILIVSMVLIGGFKALSAVMIGKAKLIQQIDIQKESFYFTEKLFEEIKRGGTIDYEEYFNRKNIGNSTYSSGYFSIASGFGNFGKNYLGIDNTIVGNTSYGSGFYKCRSDNGTKMGTGGCIGLSNNDGNYGLKQRYGQYSFHFIDYNSNYNNDLLLGDEDGDGNIVGDDDDEYIGDGPEVFVDGSNLGELYLISGDKTKRTYFRLHVEKDKNAPSSKSCSINSSNDITGDGCIGTIEYLKLEGKDWGNDHNSGSDDSFENDGVIDTWIINSDISEAIDDNINNIIAGSNNTNYWIPLFSNSINVTEFKIYGYPNKDIEQAWKNTNNSINVSPYIDLFIKIKPSRKSRKKIGGAGKELKFSMTINLTDIFSQ